MGTSEQRVMAGQVRAWGSRKLHTAKTHSGQHSTLPEASGLPMVDLVLPLFQKPGHTRPQAFNHLWGNYLDLADEKV